jgi:hypothetical protein
VRSRPLIETVRTEESRLCSPDGIIEREQTLADLASLHSGSIGVRIALHRVLNDATRAPACPKGTCRAVRCSASICPREMGAEPSVHRTPRDPFVAARMSEGRNARRRLNDELRGGKCSVHGAEHLDARSHHRFGRRGVTQSPNRWCTGEGYDAAIRGGVHGGHGQGSEAPSECPSTTGRSRLRSFKHVANDERSISAPCADGTGFMLGA